MCSGGKLKYTSFEPVLNKEKQGANNSGKASQNGSELGHDILDDIIPDSAVNETRP